MNIIIGDSMINEVTKATYKIKQNILQSTLGKL